MEDFKIRLKQERDELYVKLAKLEMFLESVGDRGIDPDQIKWLTIQQHSMSAYLQCLNNRLALLGVRLGENPIVTESKPAELPLFNEDTDRERLTKYFKSIRQLPALESNKAKSRASEYLNDLSIFIDKWEGVFGV